MILLTPELRFALRVNAMQARAAERADPAHDHDPMPAVKFFNPLGAGTWLATELDADCDTLFGLADLGFGSPELGSFSLAELAGVRLPFGLGIERDLSFFTPYRLSTWALWARRAGSIVWAETLLRRAASQSDPHPLPPDPEGDGG
ncbi:DUF2958 domain-containing protein [Sphingomonas gilva]|uniref:DUF2958 domain-containing protein n=1 Tax=Sphingomonas gilva TaxID=2305907 RepID=A0A396RNX0_9SPHN|nr:DUF2958 domain-containing protein [Sphingomonas gilva]RHW18190.1 DUF2958 domain-containing protein [Sphingomonas gilva]